VSSPRDSGVRYQTRSALSYGHEREKGIESSQSSSLARAASQTTDANCERASANEGCCGRGCDDVAAIKKGPTYEGA
jgi:hypothetical protein